MIKLLIDWMYALAVVMIRTAWLIRTIVHAASIRRSLIAILLALPLVSFAPAPAAPAVYHTQLVIVQSAAQPGCTFETAPARLQQQIEDPIGYPFGMVTAFSCSGDTAAVIAELESRASAMQSKAAAYRAAHPIAGLK